MTLLAEEAPWDELRQQLEEQLEAWHVLYPKEHADTFVRKLRRTGWRAPLPDFRFTEESQGRQRPLRPEAVKRHAAACREAIRAGGARE
jgi:hypothetical protein